MMENDQQSSRSLETRVSQAGSFAVAFVVAAVLTCLLASLLPSPSTSSGRILATAINPNTAPVQSLVRLPGIGPGRAEAIINFRDRTLFDSPNDLRRVKGIGPKTVGRIGPSLNFEGGQK